MSDGAFSVGIPFKYQDWQKDDDYYVEKKYDKFEDEIAEYNSADFNYMTFKNEVLTKAKQYMETEIIKSVPPAPKYNYYGLKMGDDISLQHVITIILYCDYTHLSSDFSSSHRKLSPFEPLSLTKVRQRKYWWWSYLLLQTINVYGITNQYMSRERLKGPFFTGMSFIMSVPEFNIRLLSPTSTSVQIQVAIKFSGRQGIILEFQNDTLGANHTVKGFNVSSISRYPEEDERYFFLLFLVHTVNFVYFIIYIIIII